MRTLSTIGYEGARLDDFISTLLAAKVSLVIDVREIPISRRKGFSKSALKASLECAGISYRHEKRLGSPAQIRNALKEDGDLKKYFRSFDKYLETQNDYVSTLVKELKGSVTLLCYERNPDECHRKSVAAAMAVLSGIKPRHLGVHEEGVLNREKKTSGIRTRQSLSAT